MTYNDTQKLWIATDQMLSELKQIKNLLEQLVKQSETQKSE